MLSMASFTLQNDFRQIIFQDSLCSFRVYASLATFNYSYLLQAVIRYVTVVYPTCLFWQTRRVQTLLIIITWILVFVLNIPVILIGEIIYNVDNQICQVPFRFCFSIIYVMSIDYMIPNSIIMLIYYKLVRYVQNMNKRVTTANILSRVQRELRMLRR